MAQIKVTNLTFGYEGSFDNIFENVSFSIDTDWKLGFIGRNGKGKTTFLKLLLGKYEYTGSITTPTVFDYFPYKLEKTDLEKTASDLVEKWKEGVENWRVLCELEMLGVDGEVMFRPFKTLSFGERTKVMLAVLFSGENDFLLIDEPTNHLDSVSREIIKKYLSAKKGFILVSHDRELLDACTDHVLVLNRESIDVQKGNFTSWWENKEKADKFTIMENEKHKKEISKLKTAVDRTSRWAEKNENTKIGFNPIKEPDRMIDTRAYIGAKTKKMQSRVKAYEGRIEREIKEKEGLLKDVEKPVDLKLMPLIHYKNQLVRIADYSLGYTETEKLVISNIALEINQGERVFLSGKNGCGKSSIIKALIKNDNINKEDSHGINADEQFNVVESGTIEVVKNLTVSYINQDTSFLKGKLKDYAKNNNLDYSLLLTMLRQLDFDRVQFDKDMEGFSKGQKKKVLIATSLITPAHLYIWDEPLNYIDIFSRIQIEKLILQYKPTMLIVEHDEMFKEKIATKIIEIGEK